MRMLIFAFKLNFVTSFGAHSVAVNQPVNAKRVFGARAVRRGMRKTKLAGILIFVLVSLAYLAVDPRPLLIICFLQGMAAALAAVSLVLIAVLYRDKGGLSLEEHPHCAATQPAAATPLGRRGG